MMRTARWTALWAAIPMLCFGMDSPQQRPEPQQAGQQQSALPPGQPTSPANPADSTKPVVIETDPAKMAGSNTTKPAADSDKSYVIGPEDVLAISVWGDPRLSGPAVVRPDGKISMNLIGEIVANGLTTSQLEKTLGDMLKEKEILNKPQVLVQVTQFNSKKYQIQGEVQKPGSYPLAVPTTILEAIGNAGGLREFAAEKKIKILRGKQIINFNYHDVIRGKNTDQNIFLLPGDIIHVP